MTVRPHRERERERGGEEISYVEPWHTERDPLKEKGRKNKTWKGIK